jgi:hypothetical protein
MARVLSLAGARLPSRLLAASDHNPMGHWEPREIAALNDAILAAGETDWCDPMAFDLHGGAQLEPQFYERAREHLQADYGPAPLIVLKEPRISLLLELWCDILKRQHLSPRVIVMVRHPLEVASSLAGRDGFSIGQSALLWLSYMLAAERNSRGLPRAFVAYDALLKDWHGVLTRLDGALNLTLSNTADGPAIDAFLDHTLRHHTIDPDTKDELWSVITRAFDLFAMAADGVEPADVEFDLLGHKLSELTRTMSGVLTHLRQERDRYVNASADFSARLIATAARNRKLEIEIQNLTRRERGFRGLLRKT